MSSLVIKLKNLLALQLLSLPSLAQSVLNALHTRDCGSVTSRPQAVIGGKGRAGPSSLHTTLEGPME